MYIYTLTHFALSFIEKVSSSFSYGTSIPEAAKGGLSSQQTKQVQGEEWQQQQQYQMQVCWGETKAIREMGGGDQGHNKED